MALRYLDPRMMRLRLALAYRLLPKGYRFLLDPHTGRWQDHLTHVGGPMRWWW